MSFICMLKCISHQELQRSNYAEPSVSLVGINMDDNDEGGGGRSARGKAQARQTISDKKTYKGLKKKKANMNIRTAILYKKSFAALLEESVCILIATFHC